VRDERGARWPSVATLAEAWRAASAAS